MKLLILAMVVVSTTAFFIPGGQQPKPTGATTTNTNAVGGPKPMPDMNLVMQMVRQILSLLLPKLMANPSLMSAFTGGKVPGQASPAAMDALLKLGSASTPTGPGSLGKVPPMPTSPFGGMGGGAMGGARPNIFPPQRPAPGGFGGGAYMPTGDAFKEMQMIELLQDPTLGFTTDRNIGHLIPPPGSMYGLSLPDTSKDYIQYNLMRRRRPGRPLSAKENQLLHLIGDPPKDAMMFGAGGFGAPPAGGSMGPMGAMGGAGNFMG